MAHRFSWLMPLGAAALLFAGCAAAPEAPVFPGGRPSMAEAAAQFEGSGVQPGERLPSLSLLDVTRNRVDLDAMRSGRHAARLAAALAEL